MATLEDQEDAERDLTEEITLVRDHMLRPLCPRCQSVLIQSMSADDCPNCDYRQVY
jgi:uncharacterized Zn finger protein (UPF0148 family)